MTADEQRPLTTAEAVGRALEQFAALRATNATIVRQTTGGAAVAMARELDKQRRALRLFEPSMAEYMRQVNPVLQATAEWAAKQAQQRQLVAEALVRSSGWAAIAKAEQERRAQLLLAFEAGGSIQRMMREVSTALAAMNAAHKQAVQQAFEMADLGRQVREVMLSASTWEQLHELLEGADPDEALRDLAVEATDLVLDEASAGLEWDRTTRWVIQGFVFIMIWGWLLGGTWGHDESALKSMLHVLDAFGFDTGPGTLALAAAVASGKAYDAVTEKDET